MVPFEKRHVPTLLIPWNKLNIFSFYVSREILATPFKINLMLLPIHAHLSNHLSYNFFLFFCCCFPRRKDFLFQFCLFHSKVRRCILRKRKECNDNNKERRCCLHTHKHTQEITWWKTFLIQLFSCRTIHTWLSFCCRTLTIFYWLSEKAVFLLCLPLYI